MRTVTRPDIKWLLVERATILGDIAKLQKSRSQVEAALDARRDVLSALDKVIEITDKRIAAAAAGTIRSFAKEYQTRGALKKFVVDAIVAASPGIETRTITVQAAIHFGLVFKVKAEFEQFHKNSVQPQVTRLAKQRLIEIAMRLDTVGFPALWCWSGKAKTFANLLEADRAAESEQLN